MFFKSPCAQCLVRPCCTQICDEKEEFIKKHVKFADLIGKIPVMTAIFFVLLYTIFK